LFVKLYPSNPLSGIEIVYTGNVHGVNWDNIYTAPGALQR